MKGVTNKKMKQRKQIRFGEKRVNFDLKINKKKICKKVDTFILNRVFFITNIVLGNHQYI